MRTDRAGDLLRADSAAANSEETLEAMAKRTALIEEVLRLLELGEAGDRAAAEKAHELATEVRSLFPEDPLVGGLYGSSYSLIAAMPDGSAMSAHAIEGIEIIGNAVRRP